MSLQFGTCDSVAENQNSADHIGSNSTGQAFKKGLENENMLHKKHRFLARKRGTRPTEAC